MSSAEPNGPNPTGPHPHPHPDPVRLVEIPGRGRGLVATGPIKAGQIVLSDSPLTIFHSSLASLASFCSRCFRVLPPHPFPCPSCSVALFCSPRCASSSHPPLLCRALPALVSLPGAPSPHLLFLLSAYSLPEGSLLQLLNLHSSSDSGDEKTQTLHSQLCSVLPPDLVPKHFSPETTAALWAKEQTNSFCLMNPIRSENGEVVEVNTGVRAYAISLSASLFNHDCLPNVCKFYYIDDPNRENNTDFQFRALHDIAEGSEVRISYLRVRRGYRERQKMLMRDYGFKCECDRCKIESQWKENQGDEDEEDVGDENRGDEMEEETEGEEAEEGGMEMQGNEEEEDDAEFPHQYFFLRYVCECGGTLAPLPLLHEGVFSDLMECNVCGTVRKDEFADAGGI